MLEIISFAVGPVVTNAYLVADSQTGEAVVVDPAWDGQRIMREAQKRGWKIGGIWMTHAHFDHLGGVGEIVDAIDPPPPIALHPADLPLWQAQGGAPLFGLRIDPAPEPSLELQHGQVLQLGGYRFEVRHAPGHTPGHVIFYCADQALIFCGDVIFQGSIGRTDLPGGDYQALINSIRSQVLTTPDETRLLSGHGPETTVGVERRWNPFVGDR